MGKPVPGNAGSFPAEYIGWESDTQGSETSQYLEEKKSNDIPLVVASENGTAQTVVFTPRGCGTRTWHLWKLAEFFWKVEPQRVIVPYAKTETSLRVSQVGRNT